MSNTRSDMHHDLPRAEARALIRRAPPGSFFALYLRGPAASTDPELTRGEYGGYLNISRKQAEDAVMRMITDTAEKNGSRVRVTIHQAELLGRTTTTYWI